MLGIFVNKTAQDRKVKETETIVKNKKINERKFRQLELK